MIEMLTKALPEFLVQLWRGKLAPRQAWTIADYIVVLLVPVPYVLALLAFAAGAWYAHTVIWP